MRVSNRARMRLLAGVAALAVLVFPGSHARAAPDDPVGDAPIIEFNTPYDADPSEEPSDESSEAPSSPDPSPEPSPAPPADPTITSAATATATETATATATPTATATATATADAPTSSSDPAAAAAVEPEATDPPPLAIAEVPTAGLIGVQTPEQAIAHGITEPAASGDVSDKYIFGAGAKSMTAVPTAFVSEPSGSTSSTGTTTTRTAPSAPVTEHGPLGFLALLGLPLLGGSGAAGTLSPAPWTLLWWVRRSNSFAVDGVSPARGSVTTGLLDGPFPPTWADDSDAIDPDAISFAVDDAGSLIEVGNRFLTTASTDTTTILTIRDLAGSVTTTHELPGAAFGDTTVDQASRLVYVITHVAGSGLTRVTVVDPRTDAEPAAVDVLGAPDAFRLGLEGTAYVLATSATDGSRYLTVLNAENPRRTTTIPIDGDYADPDSFVATSNGAYLITYTPVGGAAHRRDIRFIDTAGAVHTPVRPSSVSPFFGDDPDARFVVTDNGDLVIVDEVAVTLVSSTDPGTAIIIDESDGSWTVEGDTYLRTDIEPDGHGNSITVLTIMDLTNPEEPQEIAVQGEPVQRVVADDDTIFQATEAKDPEGTVVSTTIYAIDPSDTSAVRAATFDGAIVRRIALNPETGDLHVWNKPDARASSATLRVVDDELGPRGAYAFNEGSGTVLTADDGTTYVVTQVNLGSSACFSQVCVLDADGDFVAAADIAGTAWTGAVGPDGSVYLLVADPADGDVQHSVVAVDSDGWSRSQEIPGWAESSGAAWEYVRFSESGRPFVVAHDREAGATVVTLPVPHSHPQPAGALQH